MAPKRAQKPEARLTARTRPGKVKTGAHFPIVGIGASAGGLDAFLQLLGALPPHTGMGFVLVQHLDPDHPSQLRQILTHATSLPVLEITNDQRVKADHVYVIPPKTDLRIDGGVLKIQPRKPTQAVHRPIDSFFASLARDRRDRAVGVVLSGTANDGTAGLEAIKSEGGITFAQDDSAKHRSMPLSAVAAGCVDLVLSPAGIGAELARISKQLLAVGAAEAEPRPAPNTRSTPSGAARDTQESLRKILLLLRDHSGVDFSLYRSTTIERRIRRRL